MVPSSSSRSLSPLLISNLLPTNSHPLITTMMPSLPITTATTTEEMEMVKVVMLEQEQELVEKSLLSSERVVERIG